MNKPTPLKVSAGVRTRPKTSLDKKRVEEKRTDLGQGLYSPPPVFLKVWQILDGGLASLGLNDYGKPWPPARRSAIATLCSQYDADLCLKAAQETREIVQSQDRAPNITGLFAKKLEELDKVRSVVRESMGAA